MVDSGSLSFVIIDGSTVQEPGATETTYRLHIAIDLISLTLRQVEVSTDKIGESLDHYVLESGDVVLIDRGYNQPKSLVPFIDRGGDIVLRYNAHSMNLYELDEHGKMIKIDWETKLQRLGKQAGLFRFICAMILNESPARYMRFRYLPKKRRKPGVKRNSERRTKDVQPRKNALSQ